MTLTKVPRAEVTVTVRDRSGKLSRTTIPVDNDTTAFVIDDALTLGQQVDAISDGAVVAVNYSQTWVDDAINIPLLQTPVEAKGVFIFGNGNQETMRLEIPAIGFLVVRDDRRIDEDLPDVIAFTDNVLANARTRGGNQLTRLDQAYFNNRSTGKTQRAGNRLPDADTLPGN